MLCSTAMCFSPSESAVKKDIEVPAGYQIVDYEDYIEKSQQRINKLKKTAELADKICNESDAVEFIRFMDKEVKKNFIIDISSLSPKQKNEILLLQKEMKVLNHTAFVSAKKACKRIIDAGGYGNGYVLDYFKQRYAELSDGTPYP